MDQYLTIGGVIFGVFGGFWTPFLALFGGFLAIFDPFSRFQAKPLGVPSPKKTPQNCDS